MWYAASEIIFFLIIAAGVGGAIGWGTAQMYQLDFAQVRKDFVAKRSANAELARARNEIADLKRKLQVTTDALRGETTAPATDGTPFTVAPGADQPLTDAPVDDSKGHATDFPPAPMIEAVNTPELDDDSGGRRLSDRVADATGN